MHISVFISSHGYGHASRCSAVLEALHSLLNDVKFTIYTEVPASFFNQSISAHYEIVSLKNDVGLVQNSPMISDLKKTLRELENFFPVSNTLLNWLNKQFAKNKTNAIICDISPLGIQAGLNSDIPVFLVENFTWDWIYEDYAENYPEFGYYSELLNEIFEHPEIYRIQAQPAAPVNKSSLSVPPISRLPRQTSVNTKNSLGISNSAKLILITMGGIPHNYQLIDKLKHHAELTFLLPGTSEQLIYEHNCILIPHQSDFYHPDLVNASDLVVGKLGYSTLAEVYATSTKFLYIKREEFKEMEVLETFAQNHLNAESIQTDIVKDNHWINQLHEVLNNSNSSYILPELNGASQAANYIIKSTPGM